VLTASFSESDPKQTFVRGDLVADSLVAQRGEALPDICAEIAGRSGRSEESEAFPERLASGGRSRYIDNAIAGERAG